MQLVLLLNKELQNLLLSTSSAAMMSFLVWTGRNHANKLCQGHYGVW